MRVLLANILRSLADRLAPAPSRYMTYGLGRQWGTLTAEDCRRREGLA
jgi:hypothetical protein